MRAPGTIRHMQRGFQERAREAIRRLRPGEVATYGEIAEEAGHPRAARAVGTLLARSDGLPWWRVVRSDGRVASGKPGEQARRLREEGVRVENGRVLPPDPPASEPRGGSSPPAS